MSAPEAICPVCQKPVNPSDVGVVSPFERPARYLHPECDQAEWDKEISEPVVDVTKTRGCGWSYVSGEEICERVRLDNEPAPLLKLRSVVPSWAAFQPESVAAAEIKRPRLRLRRGGDFAVCACRQQAFEFRAGIEPRTAECYMCGLVWKIEWVDDFKSAPESAEQDRLLNLYP